jgi:hypothetical protein
VQGPWQRWGFFLLCFMTAAVRRRHREPVETIAMAGPTRLRVPLPSRCECQQIGTEIAPLATRFGLALEVMEPPSDLTVSEA